MVFQSGSCMVNVVPFPSWLSNVIEPLSASTRRLTTANPKPWPLALVVTSGVKSLGLISSGMPLPVSDTVMTALLSFLYAVNSRIPPFGIAWIALLMRFVSMRLIRVGSVFIFGKPLTSILSTILSGILIV